MHRPERIEPGPGQESVWDYPRPPRVEDTKQRIQVVFAGVMVADTWRARRVLETSHPPNYYIPPEDVDLRYLLKDAGVSICEWKGSARYYAVVVGEMRATKAAWSYPKPTRGFAGIAGYIAFYAGPMQACYVGDERVVPQPGGFYGGWITRKIVGPFKGERGTLAW